MHLKKQLPGAADPQTHCVMGVLIWLWINIALVPAIHYSARLGFVNVINLTLFFRNEGGQASNFL